MELSARASSTERAARPSTADEPDRAARVERIRAEVEAGLYETDERIELTIDLLLESL